MDTIYLTTEQVETLYQMTRKDILIGVQIEGDAAARSTVTLVAVRGGEGRTLDNDHAIIEQDGASPGWER